MPEKIKSSFFNSFSDDEDEKPVIKEEKVEVEEENTTEEVDTDKEEEQEEEEQSIEDTDSDDSTDTDFFTTIINDQFDKGVLYFDEEKEYEGSGEEIFDQVITDTLSKRWEEEYVSQIPDEYQSLFSALKAGKSITDWMDNALPVDYSTFNVEEEDTQKQLITSHLTSTGMDEEDIKDTLQEYEDSGTLEKNAKKALKYLQKQEDKKSEKYERELELERAEQERIQEQEFKQFKNEVLTTEELGGIKLSKREREQLLDHITKPVNKQGESQLVVNQKSKEHQLLLAYMDMKGFDFSKLEKQAESKAVSGLRAKLSKTTDINTQRRGETGRVTTMSKKLPSGPWTSTMNDD